MNCFDLFVFRSQILYAIHENQGYARLQRDGVVRDECGLRVQFFFEEKKSEPTFDMSLTLSPAERAVRHS